MVFSEFELKAIDKTVGALCRRRSPERLADQVRVVYDINGHSVALFEERRPWNREGGWTRIPKATFRYLPSRRSWTLCPKGRDLGPEASEKDLASLVRIVDEDANGVFFG